MEDCKEYYQHFELATKTNWGLVVPVKQEWCVLFDRLLPVAKLLQFTQVLIQEERHYWNTLIIVLAVTAIWISRRSISSGKDYPGFLNCLLQIERRKVPFPRTPKYAESSCLFLLSAEGKTLCSCSKVLSLHYSSHISGLSCATVDRWQK